MGTGRRVPGRAHSLVRDGGGARAVIDGRREPAKPAEPLTISGIGTVLVVNDLTPHDAASA